MSWSISNKFTALGMLRRFVPHLSAVSVMDMSEVSSSTERGWMVFNVAAVVLAVAGVASLLVVLLTKWAGGEPWVGLNWVAMISLPVAFLMMGGSVLHAVSRRRKL